LSGAHSVVIGFLNVQSVAHARYMVRRIKRAHSLRVGVVFWMQGEDAMSDIKLGATIGGDFVAHNMWEAAEGALSDEKPQTMQSEAVKPRPRNLRGRSVAKPRASSKAAGT